MAVAPQLIALMLAVIMGVLGNIPVIVSICRERNLLKNNHYYLLLHLAICDLFYLLFFIPLIYSNFSLDLFIKPYFVCKVLPPVHTVFFIAGANFLTLISLIRHRAVLHPFKPAVSRRTLKFASTFAYVLAIVCVIPLVLVLKFKETNGCYEEWPLESLNIAYTVFVAGIQYFIPLVFLCVIYYKICKKLITQNKRFKAMDARNHIGQENERSPTWFQVLNIRNTKTFLASFTIVACFIVSGLPAQVSWIVCVIASKELPSYYMWFQALKALGTSVVNPYVYGVLDSKVFLLFKRCRKKRSK